VSVSSYSLAASFLSGGPYLWYEPQLTLRDGVYSLWGNEADQRTSSPVTSQGIDYVAGQKDAHDAGALPLGAAMGLDDPLPVATVRLLRQRLACLDPRTNLLDYGAIPAAVGVQELV